MTVKELIKQLQTFNPEHTVKMEIDIDNNCRLIESIVEGVKFENMDCTLFGHDY